jgi:hypothetical protein
MRQLRNREDYHQLRLTNGDLIARVHNDYEMFIEDEIDKAMYYARSIEVNVCLFVLKVFVC